MEQKPDREEAMEEWSGKIIVLDDDPTGTQTVHHVSVYTSWDLEAIRDGFLQKEEMFFILTNSRSFSADRTVAVHREIAHRILQVSRELSKDFLIVLRGDSTLRGHTVLEPETVADVLEQETGRGVDGEIYCPCFLECGRITEHNIHYVVEGQNPIPVAQTEFSKDRTFGYRHSELREYLEEKTGGRTRKEDCLSLSAKSLGRSKDHPEEMERVTGLLRQSQARQKIIVNATDYRHLDQFTLCLKAALASGKTFIVRSSASLVKAIVKIPSQPLLTGNQLTVQNGNGGIVLVGSHVEKTSRQLSYLLAQVQIGQIEFHTDQVFLEGGLEREAKRVGWEAEQILKDGRDVVIFTSRSVSYTGNMGPEEQLRISVRISEALTGVIGRLLTPPSFLIAKGGITSSDVAVKGIGIKKARVLGQIKPGVPVWQAGPECRFPNLPYIIFPGNVGTDSTLYEIVLELHQI